MKRLTKLLATLFTVAFLVSTVCVIPVNASTITQVEMPTYVAEVEKASGSYDVGGFVDRLYSLCLGRTADATGRADWINRLNTGNIDGANCARGFFFSTEYLNKNVTLDTYLTTLYAVFFNRAPDSSGFANWKNQALNGYSYQEILEGFINSTEWANTCLQYGIISGGTGTPNISVTPSTGVNSFVNRLYSIVLGRSADSAGFNDWTQKLATLSYTGKEVAYGFFYSPEFVARFNTMSNSDRINIFYQTFLNRTADPTGYETWNTALNNGGGIDALFTGFADSTEFKNLCTSYGIVSNRATTSAIGCSVSTYAVELSDGTTVSVSGIFDAAMEEDILARMNSMRSSIGICQCSMNSNLRRIARYRAVETTIYFSHTRPNGSSWDSIYPSNCCAAENIAAGYRSGESMYTGWYNSEGHRRNMQTGTYTQIGIGVFICSGTTYTYYGAQAFTS